MREGDDYAVPPADERCEVALGLRQPARRDCGTLRLEGVALPGRELAQLRGPSETECGAELLLGGPS